jgi:hypothetical protein
VFDHDRSVGRIYKEAYGDSRWCWAINTSPYPAPPPHNGVTKALDVAKQEFKDRYEEMTEWELGHLANQLASA